MISENKKNRFPYNFACSSYAKASEDGWQNSGNDVLGFCLGKAQTKTTWCHPVACVFASAKTMSTGSSSRNKA